MGEPVCVNVVATDPVLEAGVIVALNDRPDVVVVAPDEPSRVVVVAVDEVGADTLTVVRTARRATWRPEVVLVATDLTPAAASSAVAAGARGLLRRREAGASRLARAVLAAAGGHCTLPPDMLRRMVEDGAGTNSAAGVPDQWAGIALSDRERAVLRLVADGHETGEIARTLSYSTRTVTAVVHDITHRFRVRNRAHAVAYALRAGLL